MQVTKDGHRYSISRVTGPTHNWLRLEFASTEDPSVAVVAHQRPRVPSRIVWRFGKQVEACDNPKLEVAVGLAAEIVRAEVEEGGARANARLGSSLRVLRIEFNSDDSAIRGLYARFAERIVEAAVAGNALTEP